MSNFDFKKMLRENITSSQKEKAKNGLNEANTFNEAKSFVRGTATKPSSVPSQPATKEEPQPKSSEDEKVRKSDEADAAARELVTNAADLLVRFLKNPRFEASGKLKNAFRQFFEDAGMPWKAGEDVDDMLDFARRIVLNKKIVNRLAPERNKQNESRELAEQVIEEIIKKYENKE